MYCVHSRTPNNALWCSFSLTIGGNEVLSITFSFIHKFAFDNMFSGGFVVTSLRDDNYILWPKGIVGLKKVMHPYPRVLPHTRSLSHSYLIYTENDVLLGVSFIQF